MKNILALGCIIIGVLVTIFTHKDGRNESPTFTVSYIMHLKGYIGGVGAILLGILILMQKTEWW